MQETKVKEVFFIAVTDEEGSDNRKYSESIKFFCKKAINENRKDGIEYRLNSHVEIVDGNNILDSLLKNFYAIKDYIVLLDQYEGGFNPNVWFELGIISTSKENKVVFIAKSDTKIPFDLGSSMSIVRISDEVFGLLENQFGCAEFNAETAFNHLDQGIEIKLAKFRNKIRDAFDKRNNPFTPMYEHSQMSQRYGFDSFAMFLDAMNIRELLDSDKGSVKYIDGEQEAFEALTKEVKQARHSLRTSRFANQSIAKDETRFHKDFMDALKEASYRIDGRFDRIICINSIEKWYDVYIALSSFCPENTTIYLRQEDFSIKFELVIIDEEISFIHFYLADAAVNMADKPETIRSTLKITGTKISKKLADIFDRLHHRDYGEKNPTELSRTLLGVSEDLNGQLTEQSKVRGYVSLEKNAELYKQIPNEPARGIKRNNDVIETIKDISNWNVSGREKEYLEKFLEEIQR